MSHSKIYILEEENQDEEFVYEEEDRERDNQSEHTLDDNEQDAKPENEETVDLATKQGR